MHALASEGRTIVVSHDVGTLQGLAGRSLLLHDGVLLEYGPTEDVVRRYLAMMAGASSAIYDVEHAPRERTDLSRDVSLLRVEIEEPGRRVRTDEGIRVRAPVRGRAPVERFRPALTIQRWNGAAVGTLLGPDALSIERGAVDTYRVELADLRQAPGLYRCNVAARRRAGDAQEQLLAGVGDVLHFEVVPGADDGAPPLSVR